MKDIRDLLQKASDVFDQDSREYEQRLAQIKEVSDIQGLRRINESESSHHRLDELSHHPVELERIIGKNHLMDISYFRKGVEVAKTVCRVIQQRNHGRQAIGSGFLVGPNLLLTNNHVIESAESALRLSAEFEYEKDEEGLIPETPLFHFRPGQIFITNDYLDYTLIALEPVSFNQPTKVLEAYSWNQLSGKPYPFLKKEAVSIIQHPEGAPKMVAFRDNQITEIKDHFIHYTTDTQPGSSGSLVANDHWEIVALHRSGVPRRDSKGHILLQKGDRYSKPADKPFIHWVANQGVKIHSILKDIQTTPLKGPTEQLRSNWLSEITFEKVKKYRLPGRR
jgi:endonuclease G